MNEKLKGLSIIAWISILAIVLASAGISGVTATSGAGLSGPAHSDSDFVPNEVIVGFDKSVTTQDQDATIQNCDGTILKRNEALNSVLVSVEDEEAFIIEITKEQSVKYAERNGIYHVVAPPDVDTTGPPEDSEYTQPTPNDGAKQGGSASGSPPAVEEIELPEGVALIQHTPNDPLWSSQWGPQSIKCPEAWDIEQGSLDVLIAIVDTGIDYNHTDLTHYVAGGYDWYNNDNDPMDDNDHGTHCAGIAAATMDNSIGIAGVAQVGVMAEKVCSAGGSCPWFDCANGITHAADFGADVISMSFGGYSGSIELQNACTYAWNNDVVLVGAAGNTGSTPVLYPARYDEVICVGSIDPYDIRSSFSSYGAEMELVAPGEDIYSTIRGDAYGYMSGTSMSTPHVAGVAALVISQNPSWTNSAVRTDLTDTAVDLGAAGWDQFYGYGKVDACAALGGCGGPGKAVLIYPAEDIYFDTTPTYTWVRVVDSTWYYLWINGPSGKIFGKWYEASGICSEQTCSVTPAITLSGGGYTWWIQTWNSGGYGPWSDPMDFSVCPPGKATLKSPSGITTDLDPEYSWDKALGSTWYRLWIDDITGSVHVYDKWYRAKDVCSGGACSELPPLTLDYNNDYAWWLLTWNPIGYGSWSDRMDFTVKPAETGFDEQFGGSTIPQNWKEAHGDWSVGSGWLHSTCSGDTNWASIFYDADYYNFVYEAKMYRGTGATDGCSNAIVVRGSPYPLCEGDKAWKTAYYFQYSRTGSYSIWKATCGCGWEWIQPWTYSEEIIQGNAWNTLKVWFVGDRIYFFINHVLVWTGTSDNYNHGRVGLSYYQSCCGDFWTDYATLDIVGVAAESPVEEVSKKQRQLNEKAKIKNAGLPKEYYPTKKESSPIKKQKNKEGSG